VRRFASDLALQGTGTFVPRGRSARMRCAAFSQDREEKQSWFRQTKINLEIY